MTNVRSVHFSEVMPLSCLPQIDGQLTSGDSCRELLASEDGTPLQRLIAGSICGVMGDSRAPIIPLLSAIPPGDFLMGTRAQDVDRIAARWAHVGVEKPWIEKETPQHEATVDSFYLGTYPITNFQYYAFLTGANYGRRPSTWLLGAYPWDRANHPVAGVSFEDALAYCSWLTAQEGRRFRLPTEVEWEYAARGPHTREYPWGNEFRATAGNFREFGLGTTSPVGSFPVGRSWCGLWDMAGNVEEFTSTMYAPYGENVPPVIDDLATALGEYPVTRGGSFARFGDLARCARRHGPHPSALYPCGFRIATAVPPQKPLS